MSEYFTKKDAEEFKTELQSIIEKNREDFQRYIGIVSEDFQHKLNLVIDAQLDIKRDVVELKEDVAVLKKDVKEIRNELIDHRDNTEMHVPKAKAKKRA